MESDEKPNVPRAGDELQLPVVAVGMCPSCGATVKSYRVWHLAGKMSAGRSAAYVRYTDRLTRAFDILRKDLENEARAEERGKRSADAIAEARWRHERKEKIASKILWAIKTIPGASTNQIYQLTRANRQSMLNVMDEMREAGIIETTPGPRGAILWWMEGTVPPPEESKPRPELKPEPRLAPAVDDSWETWGGAWETGKPRTPPDGPER